MKLIEFAQVVVVLAANNPDAEVVLSRDAEGNGFRPFDGYSMEKLRDLIDEPEGKLPPAKAEALLLWPAHDWPAYKPPKRATKKKGGA